MDINKIGKLITGHIPYSNIKSNSVVLIGEALYGPSLIPIEFSSEQVIKQLFPAEDHGEYNELVELYKEAKEYGCENIYFIKTNGVDFEANVQEKILLKSITTVDKANIEYPYFYYYIAQETVLNVTRKILHIQTAPCGLFKKIYLDSGKTIDQIVDEINLYCQIGSVGAYAIKLSNGTADDLLVTDGNILFVNNELTEEEKETDTVTTSYDYFNRLESILNKLQSTDVKMVGILKGDFFTLHETEDGSYYPYEMLNDFCKKMKDLGKPTVVNIGMDKDLSEVSDDFDSLDIVQFPPSEYISSGKQLDEYINVIMASLKFDVTGGESSPYKSNGVPFYCGLINNIKASNYEIPNQDIKGVISIAPKSITYDSNIKKAMRRGVILISQDRSGGVIYKHVNKLVITGGIYGNGFTKDSPDIKIDLKFPSYISNISNILLFQDIIRDFVTAFDNLLVNNVRDEILNLIVHQIISDYSKNLREYDYHISSQILPDFTKTYYVNLNLIPMSEIEGIKISISAM